MIWLWVALGILVISIVGIGIILLRKFPLAAAVDSSQAPAVAQKKAEIVETRLRRKFTGLWSTVAEKGRPIAGRMGSYIGRAQSKLRDLEHEYKVRSLPVLLNRRQRHRLNEEIQTILEQAEACLGEGETKAAEEKCLQAIRMEPRSVPAFEMLGDLYLKSNEYAHAKEVYRFLEKLTEEADAIYDHHSEEANLTASEQKSGHQVRYQEKLAECYRGLDDLHNAFDSIQAAYRLAPTNPKILDTYLEIAIAFGKKAFAADALEQLRTVNPDNSKIPAWEAAIANMPDKHLTENEVTTNVSTSE